MRKFVRRHFAVAFIKEAQHKGTQATCSGDLSSFFFCYRRFCDFSVADDFIKLVFAADNIRIAFAAFGVVN